jgi:hypothetical protein
VETLWKHLQLLSSFDIIQLHIYFRKPRGANLIGESAVDGPIAALVSPAPAILCSTFYPPYWVV